MSYREATAKTTTNRMQAGWGGGLHQALTSNTPPTQQTIQTQKLTETPKEKPAPTKEMEMSEKIQQIITQQQTIIQTLTEQLKSAQQTIAECTEMMRFFHQEQEEIIKALPQAQQTNIQKLRAKRNKPANSPLCSRSSSDSNEETKKQKITPEDETKPMEHEPTADGQPNE